MRWALRKLRLFRIPKEVITILPEVAAVVNATDGIDGVLSNEYKHAHAYATIKKQYPDIKSKHIGLAIEMVINGI